MSRFFSKKDAESSSEESSSDEEPKKKEEAKQAPAAKAQEKPKVAAKVIVDSSEESEEEVREVKTTAEKRTQELEKVFKVMINHTKNNDFGNLQTDFDQIQTEMQKCIGSVFATDKFQTLPPWVLKHLLILDECINSVTNEQRKKMNKTQQTAFNKLRQKFKKYMESGGDEENRFGKQLQAYKENPVEEEVPEKKAKKEAKKPESDDDDSDDSDDSDDDDKDKSDSDDSDDSDAKAKKKPAKAAKDSSDSSSSDDDDSDDSDAEKKKPAAKTKKDAAAADSSSDDSDSDDSSGSDSDSDDAAKKKKKKAEDDKDGDDSDKSSESSDSKISESAGDGPQVPKKYQWLLKPQAERTPQQKRFKWMKKEYLPDDLRKLMYKERDDDQPGPVGGKKPKAGPNPGPNPDAGAGNEAIAIAEFIQDWELDFTKKENVDTILTKYQKAQNSRKSFIPEDQIKTLLKMEAVLSTNLDKVLDIQVLLIKAYMTDSKNKPSDYLVREIWLLICGRIEQFLETLVQFDKQKKKVEDQKQKAGEELDDFDKFGSQMKEQMVLPTLVNYLEKLEKQLAKAFQSLGQGDLEYLCRLKDECRLLTLIDKMIGYFSTKGDQINVARISLIKLEHIYYKNDLLYENTRKLLQSKPEQLSEIYFLDRPSRDVMAELVAIISAHCQKRERVRAILLQSYHHAIHNRVREAKDLLMRGQFSQIINKQPKINKIHFNRAIVQIGLGYFRLGKFEESHQIMIEILQKQKYRECLGQGSGYQKQHDKPADEESEEKLPPHLHINLETIDCVYMTTSMFLEIPNISTNKFTIQKKVISKTFRKIVDQYDQKGIQFLPQHSRDYIVFAARELHKSNWEDAFANMCKIQVFQKMNEFKDGTLKHALEQKIKALALQIYIIENQTCLESMKLDQSDGFQMGKKETIQLVSKLIIKGTVKAQICAETDTLIFEGRGEKRMGQWQVGMLPSNDRKEVEFLQKKHLNQIKQMVDANDRIMELFVNQSYHSFQPAHYRR